MVKDNPLENLPEQRLPVSWTKSANISLQKAYGKIQENSPANAENVKDAIFLWPATCQIALGNIRWTGLKKKTQEITGLLKRFHIG